MSNRLKKLKRYHDSINKEIQRNEKEIHGFMKYKCESCGEEWNMYLEKGIEEFGEHHKPSPFMISCKCGGMARDISGIIKLPGYRPLFENMSYFANKKDSDCGVPIIR